MAPVLDSVAPKVAGTMSIGTIDCTVEKKLCDEQHVRGYPTLKFSIDGEMYSYEGGRSERDIIEFSKKMLQPIVNMVDTIEAAEEYLVRQSESSVAFLLYDASMTASSSLDAILQSSPLGQLFVQVSRKLRASGTFLLLNPSTSLENEELPSEWKDRKGPFFCRIEKHVPPRCFSKVDDLKTPLNQYLQWVESENVPTVSQLGAHNFYKLGRNGRPLVIAVISEKNAEQVETVRREFVRYAISGPDRMRNKYYYGYFDGNVWKNFLSQFEVFPEDIPQILVLDVLDKTYWQNATYKLNVDDFLAAVEEGIISSKSSGPVGWEDRLTKLYRLIIVYRPWSVVIIALIIVALFTAVFLCIRPSRELYTDSAAPELPPKPTTSIDADAPTVKESVDAETKDESKKEK
jgi:Thioredoxin-like domain/Thioredoxin